MNLTAHKMDRISLWSISAIAFFVVVGGIFQIRSELFSHDKVANAIRSKLLNAQQSAADSYLSNTNVGTSLAVLQSKDTDGDGLNDFEEQYVHNTSPYLADSDSDTISDPKEIAAGTNPNCPDGQSCTYGATDSGTTGTAAQNAFADLDPTKLGINTTTGAVDVKVLRQKLLDSKAISKEELDKIDDATLIQKFNETLQGGSIASGTDTTTAIQAQADSVRNMTVDQKKQLLAQSGLDSATIDKLDDETINTMFNQAVDQAIKLATEQDKTNLNSNANQNTNQSSSQ